MIINRMRAARWSLATSALLAVGAGCSDDSSTALDTAGPTSTAVASPLPVPSTTAAAAAPTAASTTTVVPVADSAATTAPPAATAPIDAAALLQQALAAISGSYHYNTTVSVDNATILTADGDKVGDGTRLGVTRDGVVVQYVITPDGTWVLPEGGEWDEVDQPAATTDPIASLLAPLSVAVDSIDGSTVNLVVTVTAASLGLQGDDPVPLVAAIDGGALTAVAYNTTIDGKPASVVATFSPVVDASPVVPPV